MWASAHTLSSTSSSLKAGGEAPLPISAFSHGGPWKRQQRLAHGEEQGQVAQACRLAAGTLLDVVFRNSLSRRLRPF
eukprot:scaffold299_cov30-Phaeocystis_antarctica.AAC.1